MPDARPDGVIGQSGGSSIAELLTFAYPGITVRPITASDQTFCRALFHEERAAELVKLNLDAAFLTTLLDQQFGAQQLGYRQAFPEADHIIIEHSGVAVGQLMTAFRNGQSLHVIDILLSRSARGRGIGTNVFDSLGQLALAKGATRLSLSVMRSNTGARRLYERIGFRAAADDGARIAMVKPLA